MTQLKTRKLLTFVFDLLNKVMDGEDAFFVEFLLIPLMGIVGILVILIFIIKYFVGA